MPGRELQERVEDALRTCLENVPFLAVKSIEAENRGRDMRPDLMAELELSGKKQRVVIESKSSGHPRLARLRRRSCRGTSRGGHSTAMATGKEYRLIAD